MKVIVISSSPFVHKNGSYFAYSPYVKELKIWAKYADEIAFTCPIWIKDNGLLISKIDIPISKIYFAKEFNLKSFRNILMGLEYSFYNFFTIFKSMLWADHIHLRCPGNIGLMGCIIQIFFPSKPKTAKYAGNWDPKAQQPWSYKLQKWILSNTFLTKNIQVLVYGEWEHQTKNIKPFFTATYNEADKLPIINRKLDDEISFLFVGTLAKGKRTLYAIQMVEKLKVSGFAVNLSIFGNGKDLDDIKEYIITNSLESFIFLKGNQSKEIIKKAYQESHFLLLPSKSEGWPKVVAEAMFWGCLPIATSVSCVPSMLNHGKRGILLKMKLEDDVQQIVAILNNQTEYDNIVQNSVAWSRKYTLDLFEKEIKVLLQS